MLGNRDFAMMDNLAYHPKRGYFVMNEDGEGPTCAAKRNNDIWACLDDGEDADKTSDACVKLMSLNDLTAESTRRPVRRHGHALLRQHPAQPDRSRRSSSK